MRSVEMAEADGMSASDRVFDCDSQAVFMC